MASGEAELAEAREALSGCLFANAWTITIPAMAPAVLYGVRKKTFAPLVAVSVLGTAADFFVAQGRCAECRERVEALEAAAAREAESARAKGWNDG